MDMSSGFHAHCVLAEWAWHQRMIARAGCIALQTRQMTSRVLLVALRCSLGVEKGLGEVDEIRPCEEGSLFC